jgi:predicted nucleic acid-binding protein
LSGFVLDCSIAVTWCFEDEAEEETDALLHRVQEEGAVVPGLFPLEVANVLVQAERRGRMTAMDLSARVALLETLPIVVDDGTASRALHETLALARAEKLTAYDAAYLELAMRQGLPLATRDAALRRSAAKLGVPLLPQ